MAKTQGKTRLIVSIVIVVIALLIVGAIALAKSSNKTATPTSAEASKQPAITKDASTSTDTTTDTSKASTTPAADPETLASVDVEPLSITVFYTKGTPGFDFAVKKTANQTQYVEFTSTDLVGTKCTADNGLFASIIKNPSSSEDQSTITQTMKVGSDTYGLSLAGKGCTSNADLLDQYQTGFKDGFTSLKAL